MDKNSNKTPPPKKQLSPEDASRFRRHTEEWADIWSKQACNWAGNAMHHAERLARGEGSEDAAGLMWIRVYGVLDDVLDRCRAHAKFAVDLGVKVDPLLDHALAAADAFLAHMTDDELLYLEYRRNTEGHPWQTKYMLIARDGKLIDTVRAELLCRDVRKEDFLDAATRIERAHRFDRVAIARAFATRCLPVLGPLVDAVQAYNSPS
jgi:hypothetical protein